MEGVWTTDMNRWQQAFYLLLQSGLWEQNLNMLTPFPLSEQEWMNVYIESRRQTLQGLLYQGVLHLPESMLPPQSVIFRWLADITSLEQTHTEICSNIAATQQLLQSAGTTPVLLKGEGVGVLYVHPEWRTCGDIDWYVTPEISRKEMCQFLKGKGFQTETTADGSVFFLYDNTEIELHWHLIDIEHPGKQHVLRRLLEGDSYDYLTIPNGCKVRVLKPQPSLVMLNAHIMKHAFTVGVGLRQFCDLARAYHVWNGQYDKELLMTYYKELGMEKWAHTVHALLVKYLDIETADMPEKVSLHGRRHVKLMRRLHEWGNFGHHSESWTENPTKFYTVRQMVRHLPISLDYAPMEMFYKTKNLIVGQKNISLI